MVDWTEAKHPRGRHGEFSSVGTKVAAAVHDAAKADETDKLAHFEHLSEHDKQRTRAVVAGFQPRKFASDREALDYLGTHKTRMTKSQADAVTRYTGDTFYDLNKRLRSGDESDPEIARLDGAFKPAEHDMFVTRHVGPEAFGLAPGDLSKVEDMRGRKIVDRAFSSTAIGSAYGGGLGGITLRIAVPKGTPTVNAAALSNNPHEREVLLPRGHELAVTHVARNKRYGYDVTAVAIPKETR